MVCKTGKDLLGEGLIKTMLAEGVYTRHVVRDSAVHTGLALASIDRKGDSSYVFYKTSGPQLRLGSKMPPSSLFKNASILHTGSAYSYDDYSHDDTLLFIEKARRNKVFTTYDPNWRPGRIKKTDLARKRIKKILERIDLLKLNDTDAVGITACRTLKSAIKRLPPGTFITLGADGSLFWSGSKTYYHPAFRVKVKDTIGAGDAYTAGLIYMLRKKGVDRFYEDPLEVMGFASGVAALVCSGKGALEGLRSLAQVASFIRDNTPR